MLTIRQDGMINATLMCKTCKRKAHEYFSNKKTKTFLRQLEKTLGLTSQDLVVVLPGRSTWVHTQVATHMASWISSSFAVKLAGWIEDIKRTSSRVNTEYQESIANLAPDLSDQIERQVRDALCKSLSGETEVQAKFGPIDIVTDDEVIEVKWAKHITHALGQVLGHSATFPSKTKRIHLFGAASHLNVDFLQSATKLCCTHNVKLTYEEVTM